eukprot:247311_1
MSLCNLCALKTMVLTICIDNALSRVYAIKSGFSEVIMEHDPISMGNCQMRSCPDTQNVFFSQSQSCLIDLKLFCDPESNFVWHQDHHLPLTVCNGEMSNTSMILSLQQECTSIYGIRYKEMPLQHIWTQIQINIGVSEADTPSIIHEKFNANVDISGFIHDCVSVMIDVNCDYLNCFDDIDSLYHLRTHPYSRDRCHLNCYYLIYSFPFDQYIHPMDTTKNIPFHSQLMSPIDAFHLSCSQIVGSNTHNETLYYTHCIYSSIVLYLFFNCFMY